MFLTSFLFSGLYIPVQYCTILQYIGQFLGRTILLPLDACSEAGWSIVLRFLNFSFQKKFNNLFSRNELRQSEHEKSQPISRLAK